MSVIARKTNKEQILLPFFFFIAFSKIDTFLKVPLEPPPSNGRISAQSKLRPNKTIAMIDKIF